MHCPIVQAFYEEYTSALAFLEARGFSRIVKDEGLVQKLEYRKEQFAVQITLEVREIFLDFTISIYQDDTLVMSGHEDKFLLPEELEVEELRILDEQVRAFYSNKKMYRKAWADRDAEAARSLFQIHSRYVALLLQRYLDTIVARVRERLGSAGV
jgi:hypothetical protein